MKKVEAAKWEAQRPSEKIESKHSERMSDCEKERYSKIKLINGLEMELQQAEASIALIKRGLVDYGNRLEHLKTASISTIE
jgi:hypothetical protein